MKNAQLKLLYGLLNKVIGTTSYMVGPETPELYNEMKSRASNIAALGMAANLKNQGSDILTMDLFNPENCELLQKVKSTCSYHDLPSLKIIKPYAPVIYINIELIESEHCDNLTASFIHREIPQWSEYPLSLRSVVACVIVHELTHCQLDQENFEGCRSCIECNHCEHFYNVMRENWDKIINNDCLRKYDFLTYSLDYST